MPNYKYEVVAHKKFIPGVGPLNDHFPEIASEKAAEMVARTQWGKGQYKWVAVTRTDENGVTEFRLKLGGQNG